MHVRPLFLALAITTTCLVAACNKPASEADAAKTAAIKAPSEPAAAARQVVTRDSPIWFEPERVSSCAKDTVGTLHWNASSFPGVQTVQVTMPGTDGKEGLFALSGTIGQKETGPWMIGGMEVVLRDGAGGRELARARVPSLPCSE